MKIILNFIALILYILIYIIDFIRVLIVNIKRSAYFRKIGKSHFTAAYQTDVFGNYQYKDTWNWMFCKKEVNLFGVFGETLSSAFGKGRKTKNTLNGFGIIISYILDFLWVSDWFKGGHCKASIMTNEMIQNNILKYVNNVN